jgi:soluble lytic murein transglycosylase-like protein
MSISNINNQVPSTITPAQTKAETDARKVAQEFEALFTSYMMKSMRSTIERSDFLPESLGEKIYTSMLDDEYAKQISDEGSLGLADLIYKEIAKNQDNETSSLDILRGLGRQAWTIDNSFVPGNNSSSFNSANQKISQYNSIISEAAGKFGVDPSLIRAVIAVESAGNPYAVSKAGAKGLMQLIDTTANDMGVTSVFDPKENIFGGTRYLKNLLSLHNGDETLALASYNAGPAAVSRYEGVPPYRETQDYIRKVLDLKMSLSSQSLKDSENE